MVGRVWFVLILCLLAAPRSPVSAQDASATTATPLPPLSENLPTGLSPAEAISLKVALRNAGRLKAGDMDSALVGNWKGYRAWPLTGSDMGIVFLTIGPTGQTNTLLVKLPNDHYIDAGQILASDGALRWQSALDGNTVMAYVIEHNNVRFIPAFGAPFTLQRDTQSP